MKIAYSNDHSGYPMRDDVLTVLRDLKIEVVDHGSNSNAAPPRRRRR